MKAFASAPREMGVKIQEGIQSVGVFVTGEVKEHITAGTDMWKPPVDTGHLRKNIHASFQRMKATIRPSSITPYAQYVHEGTKGMRARPFFQITADNSQKDIENFFNNILDKAVQDIFGKI